MPPNPKLAAQQGWPSTGITGSEYTSSFSSYSGADIKVVVTVYDDPVIGTFKIDDLKREINQVQKQIDEDQIQALQISNRLNSLNRQTPEQQKLSIIVNRLNKNLATNSDLLITLNKRLKDLIEDFANKSTGTSTKVLAEAQTISISTHREKNAVRALGHVYPMSFVRGQREIAGSIIFTVFDEHVLYQLLQAHPSDFDGVRYTSALLDQLPPVDIIVSFANEYGSVSRMTLYGVEFVNEGQIMSIEDILTENTVSYVARDYDPMRSVSKRKLDENSRLMQQIQPKRASDLLLEEDYKEITKGLDPYTRQKSRREPFI